MSEAEINKYRLDSMEEPTDEMLSYIMREATEDARKSSEAATQKFFAEMRRWKGCWMKILQPLAQLG